MVALWIQDASANVSGGQLLALRLLGLKPSCKQRRRLDIFGFLSLVTFFRV